MLSKRFKSDETHTEYSKRGVVPPSVKKFEVYYASFINSKILRSAGVSEAKAAIITISDPDVCNEVLATIREINPNLPVSCRARDLEHSSQLQELGETEIVLETLEASLQLGRTALDYATTQLDEIEKIA
ncbi:MAG: NAD-binding protein [Xenococcaceae cyanobacterium MO_167.B27]|nr:NAD-binding protein [Xenococcaceae cyanobacterium MO_167.B27]